jgi:hypothetical protein
MNFSLQYSRVTVKNEYIPALVFLEFFEDFYLEEGGFTFVVKKEEYGDYKNIFKEAHPFAVVFFGSTPPPTTLPPFL